MPSVFTVTNSPVTDAANLTAAWASGQTAGRVLGTPAGATGAVDLVQIANGHVAASAAIDYSKLNLAGSILNADISNSAAITNAKLANSAVTIGSTSVSLGATAATIAGLTLTTPTIADFTNATHNHTNAAGGGQITTSALSGLGTGVATALAVNVGSAGAPVLVNGAGGTPSSLTLTNAIGLPPATGISGWPANAAGVLTNDGSGNYSWGGGGTTINSTDGAVPYRVNSTTFGNSGISSNARSTTYLNVASAASGSGITLAAEGGTNESLILAGKGTGGVAIGASDVVLQRDAANTLAQRNSTNAQTLRVYSTYTDASNYRRGVIKDVSGSIVFGLESAGSGAGAQTLYFYNYQNGPIVFGTNGGDRWTINTSGHFLAATDNTYDIGANGATRPRAIYVGTNGVTNAGNYIGSGDVRAGTSNYFYWLSRSTLGSPSDGVVTLYNGALTDFSRLQFGGTTSSFPSLKRSSAALETKLADDSAYAEHRALSFSVNNACVIRSGSGTPESAVTGNVCDLYLRTDGGANTTLYIKESGAATNTGWIAK